MLNRNLLVKLEKMIIRIGTEEWINRTLTDHCQQCNTEKLL